MRSVIGFAVGVVFAIGLGLSGMTLPAKVIGFLDFFGDWDPSLVFVMAGAVLVYTVGFRLVRAPTPVFADRYLIPTKNDIDVRLLGGAALFGGGWGLAGYCPGPAIASLGAASIDAAIFVGAMFVGMLVHYALFRTPLPPRREQAN